MTARFYMDTSVKSLEVLARIREAGRHTCMCGWTENVMRPSGRLRKACSKCKRRYERGGR